MNVGNTPFDSQYTPKRMKIIPFWTQIHGIPSQYLTREMIDFIGGAIGTVTGVDFDEAAARVDYIRVCFAWNIDTPLRFKRTFKFGHGEEVILTLRYERLLKFCVLCSLITHDKNECPFRFDIDAADDPPFVDDHNNGDDDYKRDDAPGLLIPQNVKVDIKTEPGLNPDPSLVAGPSCVAELDIEKALSSLVDKDLAAETWHYLQAKLAKVKFTDDEFMDLIHKYANIVVSKGGVK